MAVATSNRLLPLLAGAVVLILAFVGLKSCGRDVDSPAVMGAVPQAPAPDADSPADTIKTLTANVAAMTTEVQALRKDNAQLRKENQELLANRHQIEENVAARLRRELLSREKGKQAQDRIDSGVLSSLTARVDALSQAISGNRSAPVGQDIPVGLGLDGMSASGVTSDSLVWIDPLDAPATHDKALNDNSLLHPLSRSTAKALDVKSRMVINLLYKNLRAFLLPLLERLNGRDMAQGTLGDVMVVDLPVVEEGLFEILG